MRHSTSVLHTHHTQKHTGNCTLAILMPAVTPRQCDVQAKPHSGYSSKQQQQ